VVEAYCTLGLLGEFSLAPCQLGTESNFDGADFTNAVVDRANFAGSSLKNTIFTNAVLTGTSFENANVEGADFTEAYLGDFDIKNLCRNPTLKGENAVTGADTRLSVGCKS
jgi:uncharacterized protein YjbI with pentapeptide repeats